MSAMHQGRPVLTAGEPLESASSAMLLVHGRGASAADIMTVARDVMTPGVAYVAPEAGGGAWYPNRFMEPIATNEPWLSSALDLLGSLMETITERVPADKVILLGFSQGACLALEFAARNPRRYGGIAGLSGGLIGPDDTPRDYPGTFDGTPVFLGCSDVDPHIPKERVVETAGVLERMGAAVTVRLYPGMGHLVNQEELTAVRAMVEQVAGVR